MRTVLWIVVLLCGGAIMTLLSAVVTLNLFPRSQLEEVWLWPGVVLGRSIAAMLPGAGLAVGLALLCWATLVATLGALYTAWRRRRSAAI